jgi:hypothetical protein
MQRRESSGREHGSAQRKRERENGVLPLDHLESYAQIVQDRHEVIVMQERQVSGLGFGPETYEASCKLAPNNSHCHPERSEETALSLSKGPM